MKIFDFVYDKISLLLFEREIDNLFKNYPYPFAKLIKKELVSQLKTAQKQDSAHFSDFEKDVDKREWAMAKTTEMAFDLIGTGMYHMMGGLSFEGRDLVAFYKDTIKKALNCGYIDEDTYNRQMANIREQVREAGRM